MTGAVDLFGRPALDRRSVRQLPLPLGWRAEEVGPTSLLISESNAALVKAVLDWQKWSTPVAVLAGEPRAGKSLLAAYVQSKATDIQIVDPASAINETALFHMCTAALADRRPLLIVTEQGWQPVLPDLVTRVAAAQDFVVPDPDIDLLAALLERRLADAHLQLSPDVAAYLSQRIERSFAAIDAVATALTGAALERGRTLSVPFVRQTLRTHGLLPQADETDWAAA